MVNPVALFKNLEKKMVRIRDARSWEERREWWKKAQVRPMHSTFSPAPTGSLGYFYGTQTMRA